MRKDDADARIRDFAIMTTRDFLRLMEELHGTRGFHYDSLSNPHRGQGREGAGYFSLGYSPINQSVVVEGVMANGEKYRVEVSRMPTTKPKQQGRSG